MGKSKINSSFVLYFGLLLIAVALAGLGVGWWTARSAGEAGSDEAESKSPPKAVVKAKKDPRQEQKTVDEEAAGSQEQQRVTASDNSAEMTKILLKQIRETPAALDLNWLSVSCQYIRSEADLQSYFKHILALGAKLDLAYTKKMNRQKKVPTSNPHFYIEEARRLVYGKGKSVEKMKKNCREWLALAYYREHQKKGVIPTHPI